MTDMFTYIIPYPCLHLHVYIIGVTEQHLFHNLDKKSKLAGKDKFPTTIHKEVIIKIYPPPTPREDGRPI